MLRIVKRRGPSQERARPREHSGLDVLYTLVLVYGGREEILDDLFLKRNVSLPSFSSDSS